MYFRKRFQNNVTTSSFLLPVTAVLCTLSWIIYSLFHGWSSGPGMVFCALCTLMIMELNNKYLLIRIRSRMISTVLVALWTCNGFLHDFQPGHFCIFSMLVCYFALFGMQQNLPNPGTTFVLFLFLGTLCLLVKPLCLIVPVFFVTLIFFRTISFRSFLAGIVGLLLPAWLCFCGCYLTDHLEEVTTYLTDPGAWIPFQYQLLDNHQLAAAGYLLILSVPASLHFLFNAFQDRIHVRLCYYFMLWMELFLWAELFIWPQHFREFYLLLLLDCSPIIAHFFTLTHKMLTNGFFVVSLGLTFVLFVYNLWMPW